MFDCKSIFFIRNAHIFISRKTITYVKSEKAGCNIATKKTFDNWFDNTCECYYCCLLSRIPIRFGSRWRMKNDENGMPFTDCLIDKHKNAPAKRCDTRRVSVAIIFSYKLTKCDSRTMTYLFCILDLFFLPCFAIAHSI